QHPEQHDRIDRFPAGAALPHLVRRQHDRLNVVPKALPRHQPINGFEWIALRRQRCQPLVCVEKSKLTHPSLPNHGIADETHTDRGEDAYFSRRPKDHKASDAAALAPRWLSSLLALEIATPRRSTQGAHRHPPLDPRDEHREPALGRTP